MEQFLQTMGNLIWIAVIFGIILTIVAIIIFIWISRKIFKNIKQHDIEFKKEWNHFGKKR